MKYIARKHHYSSIKQTKMTRYFLIPAGLGLIAACQGPGKNPEPPRPNIILILADDMGYSDIGCFGSEIKTPNLDRLAAEGLIMTQFYNTSRCCPSRASLMTGLYSHRVGVGDMLQNDGLPGYTNHLRQNCMTIAEVLRESGYATMISGKWHLGDDYEYWPMKRGFEMQYGSKNTTGHYFGLAKGRNYVVEDVEVDVPGPWIKSGNSEYKLLLNPDGSQWYATDAYTNRAIEYLKKINDSLPEKPFFLYLPYTAPHWPLHALPEDIARYSNNYSNGWDELRIDRYQRMVEKGIIDPSWALSERNEHVPDWNTLSDSARNYYSSLMAVYAAMIDRMDMNIGKLLDVLKETGKDKNTIIFFLSDNGGCHESVHRGDPSAIPGSPDSFDGYEYAWANASNTPFRWFKHWVHEGGISTPFIAWYPSMIEPGSVNRAVAHIIDIMPTCIDLAGASYPEFFKDSLMVPLQGISLLPFLKGEKQQNTRTLFWEHEGNRAVRDGDWKLVSRFDYKENKNLPWELYFIPGDRSELNDLSVTESEQVKRLKELYVAWACENKVLAYDSLRNLRFEREQIIK